MSKESFEALKQQKFLYRSLKVVVGLGTLALLYYAVGDDLLAAQNTKKVLQTAELPIDKTNVQDVWMSRMEAESKLVDQRLAHMEKMLLESQKKEGLKEKENKSLRQELVSLKKEMSEQGKKFSEQTTGSVAVNSLRNPPEESKDPFASSQTFVQQQVKRPVLKEVSMGGGSHRKIKHVDKTIPAGVTVKAILVSSTDAPCGVYSSTDPQPVKLRILDDGHLPKKVRAKLKGGVIIGSAFGNLSSERVNIRIERLTQTKPSGDFIETEVAGYVTGEDGKYGVRGIVVDKAEQFVGNAAVSGLFGGIAKYFQTTANAQNISQATDGLPNNFQWDMLKSGGLSGSNNALEKLSEYYIKRAEQLQPVIQIASGRRVDITFTHGTDIGDLYTKDKVKYVREESLAKEKREGR